MTNSKDPILEQKFRIQPINILGISYIAIILILNYVPPNPKPVSTQWSFKK